MNRGSDDFTDEVKHVEALREVRMRKRVYPGFVARGKMTDGEAASRIAVMEAIARDYAPKTLFDGDGQ